MKFMLLPLIGVAAVPVIAAIAVLLPWPKAAPTAGTLDFEGTITQHAAPLPQYTVPLRDGTSLTYRLVTGPENGPLVVMLHGSGWHGKQFEGLAAQLADMATVVMPDLRGHGAAPQRRGDIDYIGQFEDDIADLITATAQPNQEVILLGHSSGGGLVVRFAGGQHRALISGAALLAPFLAHNAPTTRQNSGGWAKVNLRRVIGLTVLNALRITGLNDQIVIRFAMPQAVLDGPLGHTATTEYSYRLNTSFAPRSDWQTDVAALPPFVLIAGTNDEAFMAQAYEQTLSPLNPSGQYHLVPDVGHLDIVNAPQTVTTLRAFLAP